MSRGELPHERTQTLFFDRIHEDEYLTPSSHNAVVKIKLRINKNASVCGSASRYDFIDHLALFVLQVKRIYPKI